jgi:hypothetical protein
MIRAHRLAINDCATPRHTPSSQNSAGAAPYFSCWRGREHRRHLTDCCIKRCSRPSAPRRLELLCFPDQVGRDKVSIISHASGIKPMMPSSPKRIVVPGMTNGARHCPGTSAAAQSSWKRNASETNPFSITSVGAGKSPCPLSSGSPSLASSLASSRGSFCPARTLHGAWS